MGIFKKAKPLPLSRMESKPPENMSMVYAILQNAVNECGERLRQVEIDYYGRGKKAVDEAAKWTTHVKATMAAINISVLTSAAQIDEVSRIMGDPSRKFKLDTTSFAKTKEVYRKVIDCIPFKFKDIVNDLKKVMRYLDIYCMSFYEPECGVTFDTAQDYESKRIEWRKTINATIKCTTSLINKFKNGDLLSNEMSAVVREIGQQAGCLSIAFLLIFPEICEQLRVSFRTVKEWIEADRNYVSFLSYDIADLESKRDTFLKLVRDLQQKYSSLQFSLKNLKARCDKLQDELERLDAKEGELTTDKEQLMEDINEMQLEIDRKEWRRDELLRNSALMHPTVMSDKYNEVCEVLRQVKADLPGVQRQLAAVRHKLSWIKTKREEILREHRRRDSLKQEMEFIEEESVIREVEYETTLKVYELAKRIYACKNTPDCVSKIFHEQPVEINNGRLPGQKGAGDPFEMACSIVATHIEDEWSRLYRALPFAPKRGEQTTDEDLAEFYLMMGRIPLQEIAARSLARWRRFHTRAKLDDLLVALGSIRRQDILRLVDRRLHPEKYKAVDMFAAAPTEDGEAKQEIEDYLLPYIRQIERYDKIRAHNKLKAAQALAQAQAAQ